MRKGVKLYIKLSRIFCETTFINNELRNFLFNNFSLFVSELTNPCLLYHDCPDVNISNAAKANTSEQTFESIIA